VSLRSLLLDPKAEWNHPAFTQVQRGQSPGHTVRTDRWRYTQWDRGAEGEELYDQDKDPQELHNLAALAEYASVVKQMKALLQQAHLVPVQGGKAESGTRAKFSN
jgi:iduronate 2-sulfatase